MSTVEEITHGIPAQLTMADDCHDVTELFALASKELKVGQLVHTRDFNLFESMSALELMDPKMDSGLLATGAAPLSVAERVRRKAIPLAFPSARDVLATVDELFRAEAAWIHGQPLPQTLLSCVYMHRDALAALLHTLLPDATSHTETEKMEARVARQLCALGGTTRDSLLLVMVAMAVFTVRTCSHVREMVVCADIYEEEDFSPGTSTALDALDVHKWSAPALELVLMHAIQRMEALLAQEKARAAAKKSTKKKGAKAKPFVIANADADGQEAGETATKLEGLDANAKVSALLCEALLRRLQLRRVLHLVYSEVGLAEEAVDLATARTGLHTALDLLKQFASEPLEFDAECFSGKPLGFDKSLSKLLTSGSPPREIKPTPMDEAVAIYHKFVSDLVVACSPGEWTMMEHVRIFLSEFSRRKADIVARSLVLLLLYCEKKIYGKHGFMDWMTEEMAMNGVPSVLLSTQEGVQYSARCIETVYESLKVYLHNRSRQRARIEYLLEEWSVLQLEAAAVDERFMAEMNIPKAAYPRYFTAWSLEQVNVLMIHYVLLGFELELYAPGEYSTIYWYLDYLCGSRIQNLNFTWSFLERMKELMKDHPQRRGGTSAAAVVDAAQPRFTREIAYTEMLRSMMRAYFQLFAALEREELVPTAAPVYGAKAIRFQHRFAAFQSLHFPAVLSYDDHLKNSDFAQYTVDLIHKSAEECFKVARVHGDDLRAATSDTAAEPRMEAVQDVVHVAITNVIHMARREQEQAQQKGSRRGAARATTTTNGTPATTAATGGSVSFDFSMHPHYPVLVFGGGGERR